MTLLREVSDAHELDLQLKKCAFHVPACRGILLEELAPEVRQAAELVPYSPDGLALLGSEACGGVNVGLYDVEMASPASLIGRVDRAVRLGQALRQAVAWQPPAGAKQPAWYMMRTHLSHALDHDARVLPCSVLERHSGPVDREVTLTVGVILGVPYESLGALARSQLHLPPSRMGLAPSRAV